MCSFSVSFWPEQGPRMLHLYSLRCRLLTRGPASNGCQSVQLLQGVRCQQEHVPVCAALARDAQLVQRGWEVTTRRPLLRSLRPCVHLPIYPSIDLRICKPLLFWLCGSRFVHVSFEIDVLRLDVDMDRGCLGVI